MFWKFNLLTTSHIDTLLEEQDVTLQRLMDEDDILQECKAQNNKLIEFIVQPANMELMVKMITEEPEDLEDEKLRYKYPNTACELLTSDVAQISDALAGDEELIVKLYSFLDNERPLNPLLASFFSKVMGLLITRKSEIIFEFLKARTNFVDILMHHIGTSAIMDLLLRLLTCVVEVELRKAVIEWLNDQKIVEKLVACLVPSQDEDIHFDAAQSLCDMIRLGREQSSQLQERTESEPLLTTIEQEDTVSELLNNILQNEKDESCLVNGLSVIQTLLEFRKQGPEGSTDQISSLDTERLAHGVSNVLLAITPRLQDFHNLLLDPPKQRFMSMPTSIGTLDPPLGNSRLQIARLISALVLTNTHTINVELANLGTIGVLLDLYFQYMWNNFLHSHVCQCVNTILYNSPIEVDGRKEHPLLAQLFSQCNLLQRIMEVWEENDQHESRDKGKRRGYMGHLTKIANDIVAVVEKGENSELVKEQISELPEEVKEKWENFTSSTLGDINKKNTVELVRGHPLASSSEDEDHDFRDIPFPQEAAMQQAFSDYQLQQMTTNFIDQFGFNEEEFVEQEEKADSPFSERISSIDFNVQAGEDGNTAASMFEQACNERIQQFDDNDSDEDIWEEKEITFSPNTQQKRATRLPETREADSDDSTDSEEELDSPRRIVSQPNEKMDIDANDAWTANFDEPASQGAPVAMDTSPWSSVSAQQSKDDSQEKWADFTNKFPTSSGNEENWADFSNIKELSNTDPGPRSSSPVAMDTTEPSSRPAAYLAQSAPADLASSVSESVSSSKTETKSSVVLEDVESSTDMVQQGEVTSTSDDDASPATTSEVNTSTSSDIVHSPNSQSSQQSNSAKSEEPSSTSDASSEEESSPPKPADNPPQDPVPEPPTTTTPPSPSSSVDTEEVSSCTSTENQNDVPKQDTKNKQTGSDFLFANFDFLTGKGLMKSPAENVETSSTSEERLQVNGPVTESSVDPPLPNESKAQTKEAVDKIDNVLSSTSPSVVQNGPV